jgi:branched chain amino acid efflux pump
MPMALAVLGFGVSFGVLARSEGLGPWAPVLMSATTFAGSAQFAAISIARAGGSLAAAIGAALLLNARYVPIGISVAPSLSGGLGQRFIQGQLTVDESWALAATGDGRFDPRRLVASGLALYVAWVGGTAIGVLAGNLLGDPSKLGLDAAFPALFLALLVPQIKTRTARTVAATGGVIALALIPFAPPGAPIVVASTACLLGAWRR